MYNFFVSPDVIAYSTFLAAALFLVQMSTPDTGLSSRCAGETRASPGHPASINPMTVFFRYCPPLCTGIPAGLQTTK